MLCNGIIRQSTPVSLLLGPFIDGNDGTTTFDALTLQPSNILISKNGSVPAAKNEGTNANAEGNGLYTTALDATDTAVPGQLVVAVQVGTTIFVRHSYQVVEEEVFDALYADGAEGWPSTALGARTVLITIDDGADPIQNATVRIQNGTEIYTQNTDANGQAVFNVNDGAWDVAVVKTGFSFAGATLVVDGDVNPTYSMSA